MLQYLKSEFTKYMSLLDEKPVILNEIVKISEKRVP